MTSRTFKTKCPYCDGLMKEDDFSAHLKSCPDAPTRPMTTDDMLEQLGSRFRLSD